MLFKFLFNKVTNILFHALCKEMLFCGLFLRRGHFYFLKLGHEFYSLLYFLDLVVSMELKMNSTISLIEKSMQFLIVTIFKVSYTNIKMNLNKLCLKGISQTFFQKNLQISCRDIFAESFLLSNFS